MTFVINKENNFVSFNASTVAIPAVISVQPRNRIKWFKVNLVSIFDIITAAPVLALSRVYNATKLKIMFMVFSPPTRIRNPLSSSFVICEPSIAACAGPTPGKKEVMEPEIIVVPKDFMFVISLTLGNISFCVGILTFVYKLINRMLIPNNPDNRGKRGCFKFGNVSVVNPRIPARRKVINAHILDFFSLMINNKEIKIRIGAMYFLISG